MNLHALRLLAALAGLAACRPPITDLPICPALVGDERATESDTRMLPPATWFAILVRGVRRPAMTVPARAHECSGQLIAAPPPGPPADALPRRPLTEDDLTFAPGPNNHILVWARVDHFADGTARGPVALVRWVDRGVEVRGIGTLWAPARRVRLSLAPVGDVQLLIADSQRCATDEPTRCTRELQLLPLIHQRFVQAELHERGRDTPVPARIAMFERDDTPLADGWLRRADVHRHIRVKDGEIALAEDLRVRECDPSTTPETCQERTHVRDERTLAWEGDHFAADPSAWGQVARP